jgi:hypothetical protein
MILRCQKYVIPSKKNKDSAASSEKQEEYTTEPKNFVEFVERKTARRMMVDAKMLMYELGFLKDVKQTDIECAVINQYQIAAEKKVKSTKFLVSVVYSSCFSEEAAESLFFLLGMTYFCFTPSCSVVFSLPTLDKTSEDHKKEGKKQRKPEKSTTVKKEKVISKERDSLQKEKEPSTKFHVLL